MAMPDKVAGQVHLPLEIAKIARNLPADCL